MNWTQLDMDMAHYLKVYRDASRASRAASQHRDCERAAHDKVCATLKRTVRRACNAITRRHSRAWGVDVYASPLVDHRDYTAQPLVRVRWVGQHGDIQLSALLNNDDDLKAFLARFERTVKAQAEAMK